ncbi:MAG: hypothetical protein AAF823_11485 [Planctomycetota bacterium]
MHTPADQQPILLTSERHCLIRLFLTIQSYDAPELIDEVPAMSGRELERELARYRRSLADLANESAELPHSPIARGLHRHARMGLEVFRQMFTPPPLQLLLVLKKWRYMASRYMPLIDEALDRSQTPPALKNSLDQDIYQAVSLEPGLTAKEIATRVHRSHDTVKGRLSRKGQLQGEGYITNSGKGYVRADRH